MRSRPVNESRDARPSVWKSSASQASKRSKNRRSKRRVVSRETLLRGCMTTHRFNLRPRPLHIDDMIPVIVYEEHELRAIGVNATDNEPERKSVADDSLTPDSTPVVTIPVPGFWKIDVISPQSDQCSDGVRPSAALDGHLQSRQHAVDEVNGTHAQKPSPNIFIPGGDYDADEEDMSFVSLVDSSTQPTLGLDLFEIMVQNLEHHEARKKAVVDANAAKSAKRALKSARDQAPSAPKGLSPTAEPVLTFSEALPVLIHTLKQSPLESVEAVELAKGSETEDSRRALESVLASVYKHWFTKRKSLKGPLLRCYQLKDPNPDKKKSQQKRAAGAASRTSRKSASRLPPAEDDQSRTGSASSSQESSATGGASRSAKELPPLKISRTRTGSASSSQENSATGGASRSAKELPPLKISRTRVNSTSSSQGRFASEGASRGEPPSGTVLGAPEEGLQPGVRKRCIFFTEEEDDEAMAIVSSTPLSDLGLPGNSCPLERKTHASRAAPKLGQETPDLGVRKRSISFKKTQDNVEMRLLSGAPLSAMGSTVNAHLLEQRNRRSKMRSPVPQTHPEPGARKRRIVFTEEEDEWAMEMVSGTPLSALGLASHSRFQDRKKHRGNDGHVNASPSLFVRRLSTPASGLTECAQRAKGASIRKRPDTTGSGPRSACGFQQEKPSHGTRQHK